MPRSTSPAEMKSQLDQEYESNEEVQAAAVWAQARSQATNAPKKAMMC